MTCFLDLARRWRGEAELLDSYGAHEAAEAARKHAVELESAIATADDELLTPAEAERASGYSKRRLRELASEGRLKNHGRIGAPRYRKSELPRKAASRDGQRGFDTGAEVASILEHSG